MTSFAFEYLSLKIISQTNKAKIVKQGWCLFLHSCLVRYYSPSIKIYIASYTKYNYNLYFFFIQSFNFILLCISLPFTSYTRTKCTL